MKTNYVCPVCYGAGGLDEDDPRLISYDRMVEENNASRTVEECDAMWRRIRKGDCPNEDFFQDTLRGGHTGDCSKCPYFDEDDDRNFMQFTEGQREKVTQDDSYMFCLMKWRKGADPTS